MITLDRFVGFIVLVFMGLIVFCVYMAATSPSCEDRGGRLYVAGYTTTLVGKVPVTNPIYGCEVPR